MAFEQTLPANDHRQEVALGNTHAQPSFNAIELMAQSSLLPKTATASEHLPAVQLASMSLPADNMREVAAGLNVFVPEGLQFGDLGSGTQNVIMRRLSYRLK